MEVNRLELPSFLQLYLVEEVTSSTVNFNETLSPEFLKDPVDVHGRQPQAIRQVMLGER